MQYVFVRRMEQLPPKEAVQALQKQLDLPKLVAQVLCVRGLSDPEAAASFLHPSRDLLHDPFRLPDMQAAVQRIKAAVRAKERIAIYGDYDADGVCASSILFVALESAGADVVVHLPSRHGDGYGLHNAAIDALHARGVGLIITVDCGITGVQECEYAGSLGIDMIITDHHQPQEPLPRAAAVVAATRKDSAYPFDGLCGAGVAFKLAQALFGEANYDALVQYAALATVADIVPLLDENRYLVCQGIERIRKAPLPGILAMCLQAGIDHRLLSAYNIAFGLGPRLNAAGRMGEASRAVRLLCNRGNTAELARELEQENARRQAQETLFLQQALDMIEAENMPDRRAVVLKHRDWDHGIIGIVASRVQERLGVPVWLFCEHQGMLRGSGRSIDGIDLFEAISQFAPLFEKFGGHRMAAGITMPLESFAPFKAGLEGALAQLPGEIFTPTVTYDLDVAPGEINLQVCKHLERLEPFGCGNPAPVFRMQGVAAKDVRSMGKMHEHLRFQVDGRPPIECVAFHYANRTGWLPYAGSVELLLAAQINRFNGKQQPQCVVRRMNLHSMRDAQGFMLAHADEFSDAIAAKILYNNGIALKGEVASSAPLKRVDFQRGIQGVRTTKRGVTFAAYTPAGGVWAVQRLEEAGVLSRVDLSLGTKNSAAALLPELFLAPYDGAFCGYHEIALADGHGGRELEAASIHAMSLSREQMLAYHRVLAGVLRRRSVYTGPEQLAQLLSAQNGVRTGAHLARLAMQIFQEMGLLCESKQQDGIAYTMVTKSRRGDLTKASAYAAFQAAVRKAHRPTRPRN